MTESSLTYETFENLHKLYTSMLVRSIAIILAIIFPVAALLPITYAIFGFPDPDKWVLPLTFRLVDCAIVCTAKTGRRAIRSSNPFLFLCSDNSRSPLFARIANVSIRFYGDCLIHMLLSIFYLTIIVTNLSFYIGLCFYVRAMVEDLKAQLNAAAANASASRLLSQIVFHTEILE